MQRAHTPHFGRHATDRLDEARGTGRDGARAALETFYYGFHQMLLERIEDVIALDDDCIAYHPLGTTAHGHDAVVAMYQSLFSNPVSVWVELSDVIEYSDPDNVLFVGREHGQFERDGTATSFSIRTTRLFHYFGAELGWRQVHHHGSFDNPAQFEAYLRAMKP